jgi:hypothetical protein
VLDHRLDLHKLKLLFHPATSAVVVQDYVTVAQPCNRHDPIAVRPRHARPAALTGSKAYNLVSNFELADYGYKELRVA